MTNKYAGKCECGNRVAARAGQLLKVGRSWAVKCQSCAAGAEFDRRDHSSTEDRECGDSAYEDRCAEMCGY